MKMKPEEALVWAGIIMDLITRGIVSYKKIVQAFTNTENFELKLLELRRLYGERIALAETEKAKMIARR